jgi:serine/threonine protein kinase
MVDRTGEQIGNYRLVKVLGSGGFAEVYLGRQVFLDSPAAIKLLHTNLAQEDWEGFRAEARTLVNLVHPHIIRLLDFGRDGNTPFLVMDYAPNGTLRQRIRRGERLSLATVVDYTNQVASALQYAHNEKVIHRDIKPENMLVGRNNEILLTDFGIAIVAQSTRTQFTQETVGTIAYMAPEQIQAHPRAASDQYSLGVVVYEWLSGNRPFNGSFTELAVKHMMVPPPPLHETIPDIPPDVEQVVLTALAKDPKERFGSVQAFAMALERAAKDALAVADQDTILPPSQAQQLPQPQPAQAQPMQKTQLAPQSPQVPTVLANPVTPVLPILPVDNPASNPGIMRASWQTEVAPALNTPDASRGRDSSRVEGHQATALVAPAQRHVSQPGTLPSRKTTSGLSRRIFLFGGLVTAGVVVAGGVTLFVLENHAATPPTTGAGRTPSATHAPAGATIVAQDNFQRANQQGWGTASDGKHTWGNYTLGQDFSIAGEMGQIFQNGNGAEVTAMLGQPFADGEVFVTGTVSNFDNSQLGVALRWTDDNHYYKVYLQNGTFNLIKRMGAGQNGTPINKHVTFTTQPGIPYSMRFRIVGHSMEGRAWQTGTTEPTGWMLTATDNNNPYVAGQSGIRSNVDHSVTVDITSFVLTAQSSL